MTRQPFQGGKSGNVLSGFLESGRFAVLKETQGISVNSFVHAGLVWENKMGLNCGLSPAGAHSLATETDEQIVPTSRGSAIIEVSLEVLCWPRTGSN